MRFKKDALYPGEWHLPDGRVFSCKPEMVTALADRLRDMLLYGTPIPLFWEHQDNDGVPLSIAERCKTCPGWITAARVDPAGHLEVEVEVPHAADAARLPSARFASPEIRWDWRDGSGRVWPGPSITHLAVTPRPVQFPQMPFKKVA